MPGKAIVTNTGDWLTPYLVEIQIEGRRPSVARFTAASQAQTYVLNMREEHDLTVDYRVEHPDGPGGGMAPVSAERFIARATQTCRKCRVARPLREFRPVWHTNRTNGKRVHHGWSATCEHCEEAPK